jgi:hypothetical protein
MGYFCKIFPKLSDFFGKCRFSRFSAIFSNPNFPIFFLIFVRNFARLSAPLCFNYLQVLREKNSSFIHYMKRTNDVSPLFGTTFPKIFPILLIALVVLSICGFDRKILKLFGIQYFSD